MMRIAGIPSPAGNENRADSSACTAWPAATLRLAGRSAVAILAGFHVWLFWVQAAAGRLLDPETAVRWIAAALILSGFLTLRRVGRPLMSSRQALVLWLLVALLHGHAVVGAAERAPAEAIPESVSVVLIQVATTAPAVLLAAGLLLLLTRRHAERPRALARTRVPRFAWGTPLKGHDLRFSPRPPPRLLPA